MTGKEKRQHVRVNSVNLLNYVYYDDNNQEESHQGMGRTLNLSEAGLLLETNSTLDEDVEVSLNIGLAENILSLRGKVIYSDVDASGFSKSGIHFENIGVNEFIALKNHIQLSLA